MESATIIAWIRVNSQPSRQVPGMKQINILSNRFYRDEIRKRVEEKQTKKSKGIAVSPHQFECSNFVSALFALTHKFVSLVQDVKKITECKFLAPRREFS